MSKIDNQYEYEQKKINHVFHYTSKFKDLQKIISNGFAPSYCKEKINDSDYLIPMVSFCNIPITEVDKYMRYGKNGIGMSLEWATSNSLSPVTYIHESSPHHSSVNLLYWILHNISLEDHLDSNRHKLNFEDQELHNLFDNKSLLKDVIIKNIQFMKNWKTVYENKEIVTYQEREWRYIPVHDKITPLITNKEAEYNDYLNKKKKPKPHLKDYPLKIERLSDIRYIVVTTEIQRENIIKTLNNRFTPEKIREALMFGKLTIFLANQIRNDF